MSLTDQQIAARAREGDVAAYVQLVQRYRAPLIAYVYGLNGLRDEAEELAQEAFCRVWEKLPSLRRRDRLVSWLYRIAHNLVVSAARRPRVAALLREPEGKRDGAPPAPTLEVHRAVAALPEPQRVAVSLRHFSGLSHEEIARVLSVPTGTVRSRLSRAYDRLRPVLAHLLED
ncbi:MAG: sigma-70 family RNA polymerase sigma factor [Gemmataceae bacterium]|nr:sigma-70 family RNA polymerase sigma factor [Gemmataceae bacterium]